MAEIENEIRSIAKSMDLNIYDNNTRLIISTSKNIIFEYCKNTKRLHFGGAIVSLCNENYDFIIQKTIVNQLQMDKLVSYCDIKRHDNHIQLKINNTEILFCDINYCEIDLCLEFIRINYKSIKDALFQTSPQKYTEKRHSTIHNIVFNIDVENYNNVFSCAVVYSKYESFVIFIEKNNELVFDIAERYLNHMLNMCNLLCANISLAFKDVISKFYTIECTFIIYISGICEIDIGTLNATLYHIGFKYLSLSVHNIDAVNIFVECLKSFEFLSSYLTQQSGSRTKCAVKS